MMKPIFILRTRSNLFLKVSDCLHRWRLVVSCSICQPHAQSRSIGADPDSSVFSDLGSICHCTDGKQSVNDVNDCPLKIRKTSSTSARFLLCSSVFNRNRLGNWTLRLRDISPTRHFAYDMDTSPTGHFAYWTVRLMDSSPTRHFAYDRDISPTRHFAANHTTRQAITIPKTALVAR